MTHVDSLPVSIVHHDPFARACIATSLAANPELEVIVDAFDDGARDVPIDCGVVVADLDSALRIAAAPRRRPDTALRIVVLADNDREWELRRALARQVRGYLMPGFRFEDLADAVQVVGRGARYLCPRAAARLAESYAFEPLTERESEVLSLVVAGLCNKSIGKALNISNGTVKSHLKATYSKLDVISRTQAIAAAERRGILERRPDPGDVRALASTPAPRVPAASWAPRALAHVAFATAIPA